MTLSPMGLLDKLTPVSIKDSDHLEDLIRARALLFILLINLGLAFLMLVATQVEGLVPEMLGEANVVSLSLNCSGYALALYIFWWRGSFILSSNLYALTFYLTQIYSAISLPGEDFVFLILLSLSMPLMVAVVANAMSGYFWLAVITLTPKVVEASGHTNISEYFLACWVACCLGLLFAMFIASYYQNGMVQRLRAERSRFQHAAAHDPMTRLANRATFDRRLAACIERCKINSTKAVLVYIDLDKFKPINDSYGHQAGDRVLTIVAERLRRLVRQSDMVARLGGDEFAVLFEQCSLDDVKPILERMDVVVREPIEIDGQAVSVGCSIGQAVCPDNGISSDQLALTADQRMYQAKAAVC